VIARNIELKAIDPIPGRSLEICRELQASDEGVLWQRDTYYTVPNGRLKLREQRPGETHLIHYERADHRAQRESCYQIVNVKDAPAIHSVLWKALGVQCTVTKHRRLFRWRAVRIHLDEVKELGNFIELEAVAPQSSDLTAEHQLIAYLRERLDIDDGRLVAQGYAAQLMDRCSDDKR
jgi:adenylate cyclase, class 2